MKPALVLLLLLFSVVPSVERTALAQLVAFPGADGAGRNALGGRGGDVYHVAHLGNSGAGSLRFGIESASGPRTIVFDVGGQINLNSELLVNNKSRITIAGQTAPGDGISLAGNRFHVKSSNNIVVRYLRVRVGGPEGTNLDAVWIEDSDDVMVDHVSASWATDETISTTHTSNRVTVQWSIIAEPLGGTGGHAYGSLINGGDYTYHHNLYMQSRSRNPRGQNTGGDSTRIDWVNNVLYNPFDRFGYGDDDISMNFVGNYAIAGPDTKESTEHLYVAGNTATKFYQRGNLMDLNRNGVLDGQDYDWDAIRDEHAQFTTRFDLPMVTTQTAADAFASVLVGAGASLVRDAADLRVVHDVLNQQGSIIPGGQDENWVGGFPPLNGGARPLDSDQDGMPDDYEDMFGLDDTDASDRNTIDPNGYTALENYLAFRAAGTSRSSILPGDYNGNGVFDAADYTVWRDQVGSSTSLANEVRSLGTVDAGDYGVWQTNFGATMLGSSSGAVRNAAVPGPAAWAIGVVGVLSLAWARRRRTS
jgi:hypothetical protein